VRHVSQPHPNQLFLLLIKFSSKYLDIPYLCGFFTIPLPQLSFFLAFFILARSIFQMANTRNDNAHTNIENNRENNDAANSPPPPPPTLEQVLAMQAQLL
jgi:hypothetical protein